MSYLAVAATPDARAAFDAVFGTLCVPIVSPAAILADLPGRPRALVYMLDAAALTPGQRDRLVLYLSSAFHLPENLVDRAIDTDGVPLLAKECVVRQLR